MEIIIIIAILFIYVAIDSRNAKIKKHNEIRKNVNKSMHKESSFDKYIKELNSKDYINKSITPDLYPGSDQWYQDKKDYIQFSTDWLRLKLQREEMDNRQCCMCGSDYRLECHHISYKNLFHESMDDLRTVCRVCHQAIHDYHGYSHNGYFPLL